MSTLKVGTIQDHQNSTTAMSIDGTGRILTPARPAFRARIAGSTQATGVSGNIVFETEDFDIGGNYDNTTGEFTAPITGTYHIMFQGVSATNTSGSKNNAAENPYGDLQIDGVDAPGTRFYGHVQSSEFHMPLIANHILQLTAGQKVRVNMTQEFLYSDNNPQYDPVFQGYLLG